MLQKFLQEKPLFYAKIDYERMPRVYKSIEQFIPKPKIIHIIGTNGKGSTGRFLANALNSLGYKVGHYTSPHVKEFNERVWINGSDIEDENLETAHKKLQNILSKDSSNSLSYFEYTTLLAMVCFSNLEYVIMEAGLGGERDATAVFDKILTLVTPIDFDHEAFLGSTIEEIATTKLNAIQNRAIIAKQTHKEIDEIIELKKSNLDIYDAQELLTCRDYKEIDNIKDEHNLASYLVQNLYLSISALKLLNINYTCSNFKAPRLWGRFTKIADNIVVDVGHNTLGAKAILKELKGKKITLIYNSYEDKNYEEILRILKPIIIDVQIIAIKESRMVKKELLQSALIKLMIKYSDYTEIRKSNSYLVFGSFSVVENFMEKYIG